LSWTGEADQDKASNLKATIDGVAIPDLESYRVQSPFLKPLSIGKHEIHFSGSIVDYTATSPLNFISDAKYDITIANP